MQSSSRLCHETKKTLLMFASFGYTPWYFNRPDAGYEQAWKQLMDPNGFYAPFGPATAEREHPAPVEIRTGCTK
jgi:Mannosylglycerate hydrolase MGH1-like glycoside hydrolase domain